MITSLFKTQPEITAWLNDMKVQNYTLIPDEQYGFVVDVANGVSLGQRKLEFLSVKFNRIEGDFDCSRNALKSLYGCPQDVKGYFVCWDNQLTSLEFSPKSVGHAFNCSANQLTSLEGCPRHIHGHFSCSFNALTSLQFCPDFVDESFVCQFNQLKNLIFVPQSVNKEFHCSHNPDLGTLQNVSDFNEIYQLHLIEKEKTLLNTALPHSSLRPLSQPYKV